MSDTSNREALVAEWKLLTEHVLPALAKQHRWPLRLDHCFKRVCLDFAFGDTWYRHVKKPAERHLDASALQRAVMCAAQISHEGEALLRQRNDDSLRYRGKGGHAGLTNADTKSR